VELNYSQSFAGTVAASMQGDPIDLTGNYASGAYQSDGSDRTPFFDHHDCSKVMNEVAASDRA
jgi:hypothetical protein